MRCIRNGMYKYVYVPSYKQPARWGKYSYIQSNVREKTATKCKLREKQLQYIQQRTENIWTPRKLTWVSQRQLHLPSPPPPKPPPPAHPVVNSRSATNFIWFWMADTRTLPSNKLLYIISHPVAAARPSIFGSALINVTSYHLGCRRLSVYDLKLL